MKIALPSASQAIQRQSTDGQAPRSSDTLARISSTKIGGTTRAGGRNSDSVATHSAENPKPENPRTTPARKTTSRAVAISGGDRSVKAAGQAA